MGIKPLKPETGKQFLLFMVSTGFSLLVLEWALNQISPIGDVKAQLNDRYIFGLKPYARVIYNQAKEDGGKRIISFVNSIGNRGPELLSPKSLPRLAVYGDSNVESYYVRGEDSFVGQLASDLNRGRSHPIEFINAGVQGFGPDQELLKLQEQLPIINPDEVVVVLTEGNDFSDLHPE